MEPAPKCPIEACAYGSRKTKGQWYMKRHHWSHVNLYKNLHLSCNRCHRTFDKFQTALLHLERCASTCPRCLQDKSNHIIGKAEGSKYKRNCTKVVPDTRKYALLPQCFNMPPEISRFWKILQDDWRNLCERYSIVIRPVLLENKRSPNLAGDQEPDCVITNNVQYRTKRRRRKQKKQTCCE